MRNTTNSTNSVLPQSKDKIISPNALADALPSVADLISILSSQNNDELAYLTMIGLPLRADDFDMDAFTELLRIHPSMRSCVFKACLFSSERHLEELQKLASQHQVDVSPTQRKKQYQFLQNRVVEFAAMEAAGEETVERESYWFGTSETFYNSWLSWCLIPLAACM